MTVLTDAYAAYAALGSASLTRELLGLAGLRGHPPYTRRDVFVCLCGLCEQTGREGCLLTTKHSDEMLTDPRQNDIGHELKRNESLSQL